MDDLLDFATPDYLLRNLNILEDTATGEGPEAIYNRAREKTAEIIALQISCYVLWAIRAFTIRERFPKIVIIGTGFIGSKVIAELIRVGCLPLLRILTREDSKRKLGVTSDSNIDTILRGNKLDVLILCMPLSAFASICRDLRDSVCEKTCIISACFGLRRTKILQTFKTPCIFRTFVEPRLIEEEITITRRNKSKSPHGNLLPQDHPMYIPADVKKAAEFIVARSKSIESLVHILENFYFLHEMSANLARCEALKSIFGANNQYGEFQSTIIERAIESGWSSSVMGIMLSKLGYYFQRAFSTSLAVIDIPPYDASSVSSNDGAEGELAIECMHTSQYLVGVYAHDNAAERELGDYLKNNMAS